MNITNNSINKILIVSITPYFLEKEGFWFEENLQKVLEAAKTQSFFHDNTSFLEKGSDYSFSQILRKFDEMGYERVFKVQDPGEFSQRGGTIDVFPINPVRGLWDLEKQGENQTSNGVNTMQAVRLDFLGNTLEDICLLNNIKIENEKRSREILKKRLKSQKVFSDLKGLKPGDYLVHLDHGIGKFIGIEKFQTEIKQIQDYYVLEYAKEDKLYVPVGLERKLSRYVGFSNPKISRLTSSLWQKTKRAVKEEIEKLAKELLVLYAKKEIAKRSPYDADEEMESELEIGFLYEETPDQLQAIEDIKKDLSKNIPMDRIVCGDVGFGKTEVAMRTALISASNNRQTAIICPTTILANQHFNNFKNRFENLPVKVSQLTRLQTKTEQKKILKDLHNGRIDILIGTHRILSADVKFKNLQLLIIDDEQRFGVKQKEKLREKNPALDILSLSATPIPRTIYLAMSSFKNISLVQTPPHGRTAINTKILAYNNKLVEKAISSELKRKGQVYFLHNLVESLEKKKNELKKLLPNAKIALIHGRMPEKKIIKIMDEFQKQQIDILLATTIIENGLDLPNVNTIIIEDATRLGLSQAHQIRGRVGRSNIESYAYFLYDQKSLTPLAKDRLKALEDAKELGAGYRIAIKDLELRGAGNILGKEQSGAINRIGLNLYSQILSEAVEKMRN